MRFRVHHSNQSNFSSIFIRKRGGYEPMTFRLRALTARQDFPFVRKVRLTLSNALSSEIATMKLKRCWPTFLENLLSALQPIDLPHRRTLDLKKSVWYLDLIKNKFLHGFSYLGVFPKGSSINDVTVLEGGDQLFCDDRLRPLY